MGHRSCSTSPPTRCSRCRCRTPSCEWFAELRLRWHAVPAISNMPLEIGGVRYPAAPFNGWYQNTEIGARNLADADRYDLLPVVARRLGLDTSSPRTLWRDRALVELVRAVQHSFDRAGVTMSDHHTEAERFLTHVAREEGAGRRCPADWSWIVPPVSGGLTAVYHRYYDEPDAAARPAFLPPASTRRSMIETRTSAQRILRRRPRARAAGAARGPAPSGSGRGTPRPAVRRRGR